ncbi:hypothetical protein [Variovorax sp. E3]|uniref:hypothetical protein n=1 Tax=Variovorax sp. E3 TaxID=1914993 RepID=UPI0018DCA0E9|nr:hypothetical protein [Variovorax sp. E3]
MNLQSGAEPNGAGWQSAAAESHHSKSRSEVWFAPKEVLVQRRDDGSILLRSHRVDGMQEQHH